MRYHVKFMRLAVPQRFYVDTWAELVTILDWWMERYGVITWLIQEHTHDR